MLKKTTFLSLMVSLLFLMIPRDGHAQSKDFFYLEGVGITSQQKHVWRNENNLLRLFKFSLKNVSSFKQVDLSLNIQKMKHPGQIQPAAKNLIRRASLRFPQVTILAFQINW